MGFWVVIWHHERERETHTHTHTEKEREICDKNSLF